MPVTTELADAAIWLASHARDGVPVGVDLSFEGDSYTVVLAGAEFNDSTIITGVVDDAGVDLLRRVLDVQNGIQFVPYAILETTADLSDLTGLAPATIAARILGDVSAIEYVIGPVELPGTYENPIEAARNNIRTWQTAQQMALPAYYRNVAVPIQRALLRPPVEGPHWEIAYSDLLLRVIAKLSGEPTFLRAAGEGEPLHHYFTLNLRTIYDHAPHEFAYAAALWAALGGDIAFMQVRYPERAALLEGVDLVALGQNMNKMLPSVRLMAQEIWGQALDGHGPTRDFKTLYGRRRTYVPGGGPGEYLDFVLAGTVEDIRNIAAVTADNLGGIVWPTLFDSPEDAHRHIVEGTTDRSDPYEFRAELRQVAALGGPLNPVPLNPVISLE